MELKSYYDIIIIGGGINGCGIAADASGRGLSVLLCEKNDLASATSSMSSKLIHGGLRYLEHYEFRLVREALKEREILLKAAPHLISPLEFVLPLNPQSRSYYLLKFGLFLYDHLYLKKTLPNSRAISLAHDLHGQMLKPEFKKAFLYFDCQTDDARLVIENALQARKYHADIAPHHEITTVSQQNGLWEVTIYDHQHQIIKKTKGKILVNASGPWVNLNLNQNSLPSGKNLKLVKGSHMTVPRFYQGNFAYLLQAPDQRIIFTIPFQQDYLLIGTTDVAYEGDPSEAKISEDEKHYLCNIVNSYFKNKLTPADCCWSYAGVRPLVDDQKNALSAVTRDYVLDFSAVSDQAPILTIYGGKITTYRALAEHAVNLFQPFFPHQKPAWTAHQKLPGSCFAENSLHEFYINMKMQYPFLPEPVLSRYVNTYGARSKELLQSVYSLADLGKHFNHGVYEREITFLRETEWANDIQDILWRRTKLGIKFTSSEVELLAQNFKL